MQASVLFKSTKTLVEVIMAWIVFLFISDNEEDEEMMSDEDDVSEVLISTYLSTRKLYPILGFCKQYRVADGRQPQIC
jgi:hypothetical protein